MIHTATTALILDTRHEKKNNRYSIKLRVTYFRVRKYYATGYDATEEEWGIIHSDKVKGKLRDTKKKIDILLNRADEIIKELPSFSFIKFENAYFSDQNGVKNQNVFDAYDSYLTQLNKDGRIGTANSYKDSKESLLKFRNNLSFEEITPEFLKEYESWMVSRGRSSATIGFYLRPLRAIINSAIIDGTMRRDDYPFGKNKYIIPTGKRGKIALEVDQIIKLYKYPAKQFTTEDRSRDFWLFSYLCNGMNFKDICNLKFKQISDDRITFIREKTKRVKRENPVIVEVILTAPIEKIIDKWGNKEKKPDNYVFTILNPEMDLRKQNEVIKQFIKTTNHWIKSITSKLGISGKITTYNARHSFAYTLLNSGASIEFIGGSLGHSDIKTTQNYTSEGFKNDTKRKFAEILLPI